MFGLTVFLAELFALFLLSKRIHNAVHSGISKISTTHKLSIYLFSALFLPGIIIHELSHFLTALILFVPVSGFTIMPVREKGSIRLGSVKVNRSDFVRRFLISTAPLFVGLAIVITGVNLVVSNELYRDWRILAIMGYLIFVIANTMFLSRADIQGTWQFLVVVLITAAILIYFGLDFGLAAGSLKFFQSNTVKINLFLLIPITLDMIALIIFR